MTIKIYQFNMLLHTIWIVIDSIKFLLKSMTNLSTFHNFFNFFGTFPILFFSVGHFFFVCLQKENYNIQKKILIQKSDLQPIIQNTIQWHNQVTNETIDYAPPKKNSNEIEKKFDLSLNFSFYFQGIQMNLFLIYIHRKWIWIGKNSMVLPINRQYHHRLNLYFD